MNALAHRSSRSLRFGFVGLAFAAWIGNALAAESYQVLSLVGDHLTIARQGPQTGSHLDQDDYLAVPVAESAFDDIAVVAAEGAIRKARAGAAVTMLRANRAIYSVGDALIKADSEQARSLVAWVAKAAPPTPDSRLLLILPYRAEPQFLTYNGYRGSGSVAGLGLYIGDATVDREPIPGFLGVFANLQLVLIDTQTGAILAQQPVVAGTAYSAAMSKGTWDALDGEKKYSALKTLTQGEIERRIPELVGAAR
ncbi:MAG: hypothetical protein ABI569_07065 [Casimicrobiaceae bacterium]